jgi:predicted Rossmann-fold nucleotide-binding protein
VNSKLILGVKENLFSVLRDVLYVATHISNSSRYTVEKSLNVQYDDNSKGISHISNDTLLVFEILRNANMFAHRETFSKVVCWGGHAISATEYDYAKKVGYQLGLRRLSIITGCGPGAMKAPMKGAIVAHCKQRFNGRFIGLTEPGIIAAESPNPVVKELVILPDIEKRLEAFVRLGHAIIIFPGGTGTCEEILYALSILLDPKNDGIPFPIVMTGPAESAEYFQQIDDFIHNTLGEEATSKYRIIIDNPVKVADYIENAVHSVYQFRKKRHDAYYFNWILKINDDLQNTFYPSHENMSSLDIDSEKPAYQQASILRKLMSGIVSGNIKEEGLNEIRKHGPYKINSSSKQAEKIDKLLKAFIKQKRMKIQGEYNPCYEIV